MTVIQMSERELTRLRVLIDLSDKRLTMECSLHVDAVWGDGRSTVCVAALLATSRWPWSRASAAERAITATARHSAGPAPALVREHYLDFGPTLASEKLAARHGLRVGVETLRQWMIADGLWVDRRHRPPSPHQPRRRRDCPGLRELVQIDGCEHAWFEDRGPDVHVAGGLLTMRRAG